METDDLGAMERELAESLRRLSPAAAAIDPVAAAFAAGERRGRRRARVWRGATVLALALGAVSWMDRGWRENRTPIVQARVAPGDTGAAGPAEAIVLPEQSAFVLQNAVLEHGLSGLPAAGHGNVEMLHIKDLL